MNRTQVTKPRATALGRNEYIVDNESAFPHQNASLFFAFGEGARITRPEYLTPINMEEIQRKIANTQTSPNLATSPHCNMTIIKGGSQNSLIFFKNESWSTSDDFANLNVGKYACEASTASQHSFQNLERYLGYVPTDINLSMLFVGRRRIVSYISTSHLSLLISFFRLHPRKRSDQRSVVHSTMEF
uniref:Uncharacterized protein n=1 Tax=Glossina pallidipes TaxID=7398 RepID=A0A1A9ZXJ3_GLOPL